MGKISSGCSNRQTISKGGSPIEWWLLGVGGRGRGVVQWVVSVWQDEKSSGDRLHNNTNSVNTINCTFEMVKIVNLCYVYFTTQLKKFLKTGSICELDFVNMAKALLSRNGDMKGRWNTEQSKCKTFYSNLKEKYQNYLVLPMKFQRN